MSNNGELSSFKITTLYSHGIAGRFACVHNGRCLASCRVKVHNQCDRLPAFTAAFVNRAWHKSPKRN